MYHGSVAIQLIDKCLVYQLSRSPYTVVAWLSRKLRVYLKGFWNRGIVTKAGKDFAEMRWEKNMRTHVYHGRIKHNAAVGEGNASLTWTLLRDARESGRRPAMESGQDF